MDIISQNPKYSRRCNSVWEASCTGWLITSLKTLFLTGFSNTYIGFSKNVEITFEGLIPEYPIIAPRVCRFYTALQNCWIVMRRFNFFENSSNPSRGSRSGSGGSRSLNWLHAEPLPLLWHSLWLQVGDHHSGLKTFWKMGLEVSCRFFLYFLMASLFLVFSVYGWNYSRNSLFRRLLCQWLAFCFSICNYQVFFQIHTSTTSTNV